MIMVKSKYKHRKLYAPSIFKGGLNSPRAAPAAVRHPIKGRDQWVPPVKVHELELFGRDAFVARCAMRKNEDITTRR